MNQKTKNRLIELSILVVVLLLVLGVKSFDYYTNVYGYGDSIEDGKAVEENSSRTEDQLKNEGKSQVQLLTVQIAGAVANPDVYEVPAGSRINDVIKLSGGFLEDADQTTINLALKVYDTQKIMVFKVGEAPIVIQENELGDWTLQDLNEADASRLMEIKGIGESMAGKILDYRKTHGPFNDIDELLSVNGIGEKKLQTIKEAFESGLKK